MRYKINPFPAVRVNAKGGRFQPRAIAYHNKIKELRRFINDPIECMQALIEGNYDLYFMIEMPKSWSKKKRQELNGQPHRQTPDIDNLFKAFTDTIFYNQDDYDDKEIYKMKARKYWGEQGEINFNIIN